MGSLTRTAISQLQTVVHIAGNPSCFLSAQASNNKNRPFYKFADSYKFVDSLIQFVEKNYFP